MKRYYVDSVIEGKKQTDEVTEEVYKRLKTMGGTFPLKVYKESAIPIQNENGEVMDLLGVDRFEFIDIPYTLRVEKR